MKVLPALFLLLVSFGLQAANFPDFAQLPIQTNFPDPLIMFDGQPVKTKRDWIKKRKPELKALLQHYEYGFFPPATKITATIDRTDEKFFKGKATLKLVTIEFGVRATRPIHLLLAIPNDRIGPAPVFLGLNFDGNHQLLSDTNIPLPTIWMRGKPPEVVNSHATDAGRGKQTENWAIEQSIDRGYAVASFCCGDIELDQTNALGGVRETLGIPQEEDSWGTIAAWAWGLQRAVDYLETDSDIDASRIAVVGHSRLGKTAMLAGAFDERIALIIPLQAGCGGTSPCRGTVGESVEKINTSFPHWFCGEFKKFNQEPQRLPFDQHCLIALCAPRPVLISCATGDEWSNPAGQFEMLQAASPVYRLMGHEGAASKTMPATGHLMDSPLGYFIRPGKHSMTKLDWKAFLDFADKNMR